MQQSSSLPKLVELLDASQHRTAHPVSPPLSRVCVCVYIHMNPPTRARTKTHTLTHSHPPTHPPTHTHTNTQADTHRPLLLSELSHDELAGLVLSSTMLCPSPLPSASAVTPNMPNREHEQQPPPMQTHSHYAGLTTPFPSPDRPLLQRAAGTLMSKRDPAQPFASAWIPYPNQQDQADCLRQIAYLEMALKTSLETQKTLQEQMAAEIKTRKLCEQALETCRQEREREQAERESERAAMEQSTREVGEKAIKFVESEIMRLNERFLQLETKLREAEKQRDNAIAATGGHNATPQTRIQPCKGPPPRHEHSHASIAGTGTGSSRQISQQPPEPHPQHRLPSESGGECACVHRCVRCRTCSIFFKVMFTGAESLLTP